MRQNSRRNSYPVSYAGNFNRMRTGLETDAKEKNWVSRKLKIDVLVNEVQQVSNFIIRDVLLLRFVVNGKQENIVFDNLDMCNNSCTA
jgi:hypothetical protein